MTLHKIIVSGLVGVALFGASIATAQTYYPSYGTSYASSCVSLSSNLSFGARSGEVSSLQRFLVSQNYPGSGSWMVTSYFGRATEAALRIYQQQHGLPATGWVDAATRASISSGTCGYGYAQPTYPSYSTYPMYPSYPTYPTYPTYPQNNNCSTYPYSYGSNCNNNYPYSGTVTLSYLSPTYGQSGTNVTIYGTGFDYSNNTVYFGGQTISNVVSYNGTSLNVNVPWNISSNTQVYVTNSRGTSNSLSFTVNVGSGCGYTYYNNNCCTYPYNTYGCNQQGLTISTISPHSGAVGTLVNVNGTGFSPTGNTVRFGNAVISNLNSSDGTVLAFTVPSYFNNYYYQQITPGTYNVSVTNSAGLTSNSLPFTVTSGSSNGSAPTITSVNGPTNLGTGVSGTWTVTLYNPNSGYVTTSVNWGDTGNGYVNAAAPQTSYTQGSQTLTFTHPYYTSGVYTITFTVSNQNGQQTSSTVTVSIGGSGQSGSVNLNSLSPTSGHVGTQITLTGSGFTGDNTIHFGVGGTQHVTSASNTYLYFTVPSYLSPCDVTPQGSYCAQYLQQVTPGSYQVYVTNGSGTSQTLTFTVN